MAIFPTIKAALTCLALYLFWLNVLITSICNSVQGRRFSLHGNWPGRHECGLYWLTSPPFHLLELPSLTATLHMTIWGSSLLYHLLKRKWLLLDCAISSCVVSISKSLTETAIFATLTVVLECGNRRWIFSFSCSILSGSPLFNISFAPSSVLRIARPSTLNF